MQDGCHRHGGPFSRKDNGESGLGALGWSWGRIAAGPPTRCDLFSAFNPSILEGSEISRGFRHFQRRAYCYRPRMKGRGSNGEGQRRHSCPRHPEQLCHQVTDPSVRECVGPSRGDRTSCQGQSWAGGQRRDEAGEGGGALGL